MAKQFLAVLSTSVLLAGCAAEYGERDFMKGGYTTTQISNRDFLVGYENGLLFNNATNPAKRDQFIMIQAAELTLNHGYTHFTVSPSVGVTQVKCYSQEEAPAQAYDAKNVILFQNSQSLPN